MSAQNYDESKIPPYTIPELLVDQNGREIETVEQWKNHLRQEVLKIFTEQMYGRVPEFDYHTTYRSRPLDALELEGKATQEEVTITLSNEDGVVKLNMLLTIPLGISGPVPVFLGLNFLGNQATNPNPEIAITENYVIGNDRKGIVNNKANAESRGIGSSRWPVDLILEEGYGLATIHCGDIDPDFDDGFNNGVHALAGKQNLLDTLALADHWGTVAAWAWGLSRALDYLQTDERIDPEKVVVIGHSRLGKAALWAGAVDQRFALVISNNSGCGGAALSRRRFGETVAAINTQFPHWFCQNFHRYNGKEDDLPIDQHMLMALIAPRPVYVASASEDLWADPKGEYISLFLAGPVYELYGFDTIHDRQFPAADHTVTAGKQAYHLRSGEHDLTPYDWEQYLKFADLQLTD